MKSQMDKVVSDALAAGAQGADVIAYSGKSLSLSAQKAGIDKQKVANSSIYGLRVIKDKKVGISYSESDAPEALERMVKQAVENSKYAAVDEFQQIHSSDTLEYVSDKKHLCPEDDTSLEEKIELTLALEKSILEKDERFKSSPYNGYGESEVESYYLNSKGVYRYDKERSLSCYVSGLASSESRQAMYGASSVGRHFSQLDSQACIELVAEHGLNLLDAKAIPTGRYDLVFDTDALQSFLSAFISSFSAKAVLDGKSSWKTKQATEVAHADFTMRDEPRYENGFYELYFDDEGQARNSLSLVENGVLLGFLHNTLTAKKMGVETTGHGSRSAKSSLGISASQIVIDPGKDSESSIQSGTYLKVLDLKGLHSGTDVISGHFSLAVEGMLYQAGILKQYVKDVTISGNFYELFKKIIAIGDRQQISSSKSFFSPSLVFEGISVAGS